MSRFAIHLHKLLIGSILLVCSIPTYAESCILWHKRAPVNAVCGRVMGMSEERLEAVELTLTDDHGKVLFSTKSDKNGKFSFRGVPNGDYTLHAHSSGYHEPERQLRVIRSNSRKCGPMIQVQLSLHYCSTSVYVKGVDKPSDLDADWNRKEY